MKQENYRVGIVTETFRRDAEDRTREEVRGSFSGDRRASGAKGFSFPSGSITSRRSISSGKEPRIAAGLRTTISLSGRCGAFICRRSSRIFSEQSRSLREADAHNPQRSEYGMGR